MRTMILWRLAKSHSSGGRTLRSKIRAYTIPMETQRIMEYTWKQGIQGASHTTFKSSRPVEVGNVLVDLCTGEKYKVLAIAKAKKK